MSIIIDTQVSSDVNLDRFFAVMIQGSDAMTAVVNTEMNEVGNALAELIYKEIEDKHPIGEFMVNRMQVDHEMTGNGISIQLHGIPENEVNDKYTEAWLQDPDTEAISHKPVGSWDLWHAQEFGAIIPAVVMEDHAMKFQGPEHMIFAYTRAAGSIGKYKGEVRAIMLSFKEQISEFVSAVLTDNMETYMENLIEVASDKKLKPKTDKSKLMSKLGINNSWLKQHGVDLSFDSAGRTIFRESGKRISQSKVTKMAIK